MTNFSKFEKYRLKVVYGNSIKNIIENSFSNSAVGVKFSSTAAKPLAKFIIKNGRYLNNNNWIRIGVGKNATNSAHVMRLSLGAGPKAYQEMSPGLLKTLNSLLKNFGTEGHFYFPNWPK